MNFGSIKCIEMKLWYSLGIYLDFFILLYWSNITAISIVLLLTLAWWIEKLSCSLAFKVFFLKKPSHCSARVCFALNRPAQTPGIYNHGHRKSGIVLFSRNILLLAIFLSFPQWRVTLRWWNCYVLTSETGVSSVLQWWLRQSGWLLGVKA